MCACSRRGDVWQRAKCVRRLRIDRMACGHLHVLRAGFATHTRLHANDATPSTPSTPHLHAGDVFRFPHAHISRMLMHSRGWLARCRATGDTWADRTVTMDLASWMSSRADCGAEKIVRDRVRIGDVPQA
mmetsp:Transcript_61453/g.162720  ORF Transcript_61453/g.162720 Transcript_61453/m.162720 type:complete len:130 (+) Transcript_61453:427-816(+)